jgi:hypothetical protein
VDDDAGRVDDGVRLGPAPDSASRSRTAARSRRSAWSWSRVELAGEDGAPPGVDAVAGEAREKGGREGAKLGAVRRGEQEVVDARQSAEDLGVHGHGREYHSGSRLDRRAVLTGVCRRAILRIAAESEFFGVSCAKRGRFATAEDAQRKRVDEYKRDLDKIADMLDLLKREYDLFFAGARKRQPTR